MTTEIVYNRTTGDYTAIIDGETVGEASTFDQADAILTAYIHRFGEPDDTKDQQPTGWCHICGCAAWEWEEQGPLCPDHIARQSITVEGMELTAPTADATPRCACGESAMFFVQYPGKIWAYCYRHYEELTAPQLPLLAQCAALCDALLGRAPAGGGIVDEVRRVRAALAAEGW